MKTVCDNRFGLVFLLFPISALVLGAQISNNKIDRETLAGRSFEFSWTSQQGGAVNGIATLNEDGSIKGIASPNETTWLIDSSGGLLFKHADGRVSTRYDKVWLENGRLCFEGPFLFKEGITHHLTEVEGAAPEPTNEITPAQAARIKYSSQRFVYLDIGQSCDFQLKDGTKKRISLLSVKEYKDPVIHLVRQADVKIEIDGKAVELTCAPYVMPTEIDGLRIQADTTSAWMDIPKRVQLSLWDASDPIVDTGLFCFPLPGYRLFCLGMQTYNEPVHLGDRDGDPQGQRFYHNYGVDFAGYETRQKVLSCIDGVVTLADRDQGSLSIRDDKGFVFYYGHLDSILSGIEVGAHVKKGQWVGMLGKRGASGNFSHLHIGAYLSDSAMAVDHSSRNLNLFPWLVAAYWEDGRAGLYAVARPHKMALTGDTVLFDGSSSMAPNSNITSFKWEFHDGASANGPVAEKVYDKPGCYITALWVKDDRGAVDVDLCKVKVYSRSAPEDVIPTIFVTYYPSSEVNVDEPVNFRLWPQGMEVENIRIDFGDGAVVQDYRPYSAITHKFKDPGIHIVTVTGTADKLPVTQKVKVIVRE
ncbi:MAG: peptidoglycan DD-metalloendopeptidase family protein [Sedimentisphaerales bacterium]|nr:peptidoglycan DD-metalloendopeptidase family protein [Sedimentisphaerales bacterium]